MLLFLFAVFMLVTNSGCVHALKPIDIGDTYKTNIFCMEKPIVRNRDGFNEISCNVTSKSGQVVEYAIVPQQKAMGERQIMSEQENCAPGNPCRMVLGADSVTFASTSLIPVSRQAIENADCVTCTHTENHSVGIGPFTITVEFTYTETTCTNANGDKTVAISSDSSFDVKGSLLR